MKPLLLLIALFSVNAQAEFTCNWGNGSYLIKFAPDASTALFTIVNASGVEDAQGTLTCDGPQESAYVCEGNVRELDGRTFKFNGPARHAELVAQETALQSGIGTMEINGDFIRCSSKK
ncbi:MAG: hypothetical protein ACXVB9_19885 [Bdellovibrionota bacterium]